MTANAFIYDMYPSSDHPDRTCHVIQFSASDDPRSGQIVVEVDMLKPVDEIRMDICQGLVDYINTQRGSVLIGINDIRLL
jgi:hypothetical protein